MKLEIKKYTVIYKIRKDKNKCIVMTPMFYIYYCLYPKHAIDLFLIKSKLSIEDKRPGLQQVLGPKQFKLVQKCNYKGITIDMDIKLVKPKQIQKWPEYTAIKDMLEKHIKEGYIMCEEVISEKKTVIPFSRPEPVSIPLD